MLPSASGRGAVGISADTMVVGYEDTLSTIFGIAEGSATWGDIKRATHRMTVQGRVYARLYWDKSLADAPFQVETKNGGVVVLKGSVPSAEAKHRAVELAQSTVGVNDTVDELGIAPNKTR